MKYLQPWKPKPHTKLGAGASLCDEASHFIHHMGNMIAVLMLRMETREMLRAARQEEREKIKRRAEALRSKHRRALSKMRKGMAKTGTKKEPS